MKLLLALVLSLAVFAPVQAQLMTITATGTITNVGANTSFYLGSSIQVGDTLTESFTFQSDGQGGFTQEGGTSTISVGDYNLVSDNAIGSQSAYIATYTNGSGPFGLSGYVLNTTVNTPRGLAQGDFFLETTDPTVASLITTGNVVQLPLSDFNYDTGMDLNFLQISNASISGNLTSYSVDIAVPEPATLPMFALSLLGLAVVFGFRNRARLLGAKR